VTLETTQNARKQRTGGGSGLTWWAAAGFTIGMAALLALVMIASATPVDAEVLVAQRFGLDIVGGDFVLRSAGILFFLIAAGALFAQSATHSRQLEAAERKRNPRPRE
jgi:hypothetical protein